MRNALIFLLTPLIALPLLASKTSEKPNLVFIIADDCTYLDMGVYGGQVPTEKFSDSKGELTQVMV